MTGQQDVAGRALQVGDVIAATFGNMSSLGLFTITSFTPKGLRAAPHRDMSSKSGQWATAKAGTPIQRFPDQVCLVSRPEPGDDDD